MISSLFSRFDPCSSSLLFNNWGSTLLLFFIIPSAAWILNNRLSLVFHKLTNILYQEFKLLVGHSSLNNNLILISLFLIIIFNNFIGLFPYIFTRTSHLVITLSLAAPLWISFILYGWINNTKHIFAHIVPLSTPNALIPFIVVIERISNIIRPGTLTVRLSANIIAGHLLITLLGNQTSHASFTILIILLITQIILLRLESAVAIIQAYVFTVLSTLYSSEVVQH